MATSRNALSRKGTRASSPQAMVDLYIRKMRVRRGHELALVGPETVRSVQVLDAPDAFLVEGLWVGGRVEIQIT